MTFTTCFVAFSLLAPLATPSGSEMPSMEPRVRLEAPSMIVHVEGLDPRAVAALTMANPAPAQWHELLRVVAVDPDAGAPVSSLPALLGSYSTTADSLRFEPRFAPAPGLVVEAYFDGAVWDSVLDAPPRPGSTRSRTSTPNARAQLLVPEPSGRQPTRVEAVYPGEQVPTNLLRLYVHFSAPMSARHVLRHVQLLDDSGEQVSDAFVEVPGGLWNRDRTRLTLFVHPGRVKRGVGPGQVLGPVLEAGRTYRLRINSEAEDVAGHPLAQTFEKALRVGPEDLTSPDPSRWRIAAPTSPSAPLVVDLDEPADRALLQRLPSIFLASGSELEGRIAVDAGGKRFTFAPTESWNPGRFRLEIPAALEDPSGNRLDRLFEEKPGNSDTAAIPFVLLFEIPAFDEP